MPVSMLSCNGLLQCSGRRVAVRCQYDSTDVPFSGVWHYRVPNRYSVVQIHVVLFKSLVLVCSTIKHRLLRQRTS